MSKEFIKEVDKVAKMTTKEIIYNLSKEEARFKKEGVDYYKIRALKAELYYRENFKR